MSTFSDISNNPSSWYIVTDQVMGGKSELQAGFDDGVFSLKGYVTTVNNGGFVRLAHRPKDVDKEVKGIRFMAKGNNETYEVHVTMQGLRCLHGHITARLLMLLLNGKYLKLISQILKRNLVCRQDLTPRTLGILVLLVTEETLKSI